MNDGEIWEMETMAAEAADLPRTRPSGLYPFHPPGLVLWLQQYPLDCSINWQSLRGCTVLLPLPSLSSASRRGSDISALPGLDRR